MAELSRGRLESRASHTDRHGSLPCPHVWQRGHAGPEAACAPNPSVTGTIAAPAAVLRGWRAAHMSAGARRGEPHAGSPGRQVDTSRSPLLKSATY